MGKRLYELVDGAPDVAIAGVVADSRQVRPGFLFAALPGSRADGAAFARAADAAGAAAILAGAPIRGVEAPVVVAADVRRAYALAAQRFFGPAPRTCVAVTGTNGKTSVAVFCRQIFAALGHTAASIGTLGVTVSGPEGEEAVSGPGLTTPDAAELARTAADLGRRGVTHLALEASSHGIDQRRLDGLALAAAGFTNLTQDHLDYHGDMERYRAAKLRLFDTLLPSGAPAVLNADSPEAPAFARAAARHGAPVLTVGEAGGLIRLMRRTPGGDGQTLELEAVRAALEGLKGAPGRLQRVGAGPLGGEAYVDYAHTPDGLETVLRALRPHARGRLMVVFGAGGDRDRGKRPLMGRVAAELADLAIVTDDNPRSEDPAVIRREILAAAPGAREMADRRAAIGFAVESLRDGDVLVVAGKGHEQGQTVAGVVHPFDDVTEVRRAIEAVHV